MTYEHRAPSRLAPSHPNWHILSSTQQRTDSGGSVRQSPTWKQEPSLRHTSDNVYDNNEADTDSQINTPDIDHAEIPKDQPSTHLPDESHLPARAEPFPQEISVTPDRIPIKELYEPLFRAIHLRENKWKLARVQAHQARGLLRAYLVPLNCRFDLKTAMSKNLVLTIAINSQGTTSIKEPEKRGFWRKLKSWLFGE